MSNLRPEATEQINEQFFMEKIQIVLYKVSTNHDKILVLSSF